MICVFDPLAEDFTGNGAAVLQPLSASIRMIAGGEYTCSLKHPIDKYGKWTALKKEAIIRLPVPEETIENAYIGYEVDIYKTTVQADLRERAEEPTGIVYTAWNGNNDYTVGSKVTHYSKNYRCKYFDPGSGARYVPPNNSSWWVQIPRETSGAPVLSTLKVGTELYLVEDVDNTWFKMSTPYGLMGYIKKSQVRLDRHVTPSETDSRVIREQLFRIKDVTVDRKTGTVSVSGAHVSSDLKGNLVEDVELSQASAAMAVGKVAEGLLMDYPGEIATNLTGSGLGTYTGSFKMKNGIFCLLDPDSGIVPTFDAKLIRDNWDLFVMRRETTNRGYKIRYGKNMNGVNWRQRSDALVTRVIPEAKDVNGDVLHLPEMWVDSAKKNNYPVIYMEPLKVNGQVGKVKAEGSDDTWTEADLFAEMRTKAGERFTVDHVDDAVEEVTVQLEQLETSAEFAWLRDLLKVLLYDTVTVEDAEIGLDRELTVSELEYDCIKKKITGVKLVNSLNTTGRTTTGYNVANASIGKEKLKNGLVEEIVQEAVDKMPEYADPENHTAVIDNLTSTSTTSALSANQGRVLNDKFANYVLTADIKDNLTSTDTDKPLSANQGKALNDKFADYVPKSDIKDNLTSTDTNKPLSAKQGKTLNDKFADYVPKSDIKDNLTSTDTNKPLSAKQGKTLYDKSIYLKSQSITFTNGQATVTFSESVYLIAVTSFSSGYTIVAKRTTGYTVYTLAIPGGADVSGSISIDFYFTTAIRTDSTATITAT